MSDPTPTCHFCTTGGVPLYEGGFPTVYLCRSYAAQAVALTAWAATTRSDQYR